MRPVNGNYAAGGNVAKAPHNPVLLANRLRGRESPDGGYYDFLLNLLIDTPRRDTCTGKVMMSTTDLDVAGFLSIHCGLEAIRTAYAMSAEVIC